MSDPVILFVKPKAISAEDKKALQRARVIVVEIANVADAKLIRANTELPSTSLLRCAASAIAKAQYEEVRQLFAKAVCAAIAARRASGLRRALARSRDPVSARAARSGHECAGGY